MNKLRKAAGEVRGRIGIAVFAAVIAAGALGATAVAFARQSPSTGPGAAPAPAATSPRTMPNSVGTCSSDGMRLSVDSSEGAAGTLRYVWRALNVSGMPCRAFGYPAMDFHASTGWLHEQVRHGGYPDIDRSPKHVVVAPGHSLYFASYWSDVTTDQGSCTEFDRVQVALPGSGGSNTVQAEGCLTQGSVRVGPVSSKPPAI